MSEANPRRLGDRIVKRRIVIPFLAATAVALLASAAGHPVAVTPAHAATCGQYSNQAAAQRAHDTRDADGDGIDCESLPCPCATGGGGTAVRERGRKDAVGELA